MALIKCPECNREISDKAKACIHCGFPIAEYLQEQSVSGKEAEVKEAVEEIEETITNEPSDAADIVDFVKAFNEENDAVEDDKEKKVETSDTTTEPSAKWMAWLVIAFVALIIIVFVVQTINENKKQQEIANQAISHFKAGEFEEAYNDKGDLDKDSLLGEYENKIVLMGKLQSYLDDEDKQLSAVFYYLGKYKEFERENLLEMTLPLIKEAAQKVANKNRDFIYNVEYYADRKYEEYTYLDNDNNEKLSDLLEPLLSEDRERLFEIANQINSNINYTLAKTEYEKYKKEQEEQAQREYDREHPIQISNEDYTVTRKDGYYYCNGTVHNISGSTHYYVKVKVTYMDENKDVLTTDWTYAVGSEGIKGGENQQFEIMTKVSGTVGYYRCEILEWD